MDTDDQPFVATAASFDLRDVAAPPPRRFKPRTRLPVVLFVLTCLTTFFAAGPIYCVAVMATLLTHELGHYLQALRYRVPASLPYFIPMPIGPLGTMGAVIAMHPGMGNRKSLFDIGITGPLAGLVPAIVFSAWGLLLSEIKPVDEQLPALRLGDPLLFRWLAAALLEPIPPGHDIFLHPLAYAGWVGILITALNLIPISQLDGGHILYALLLKRSHVVARVLFAAAAVSVVVFGYWGWSLMLLLLLLVKPAHPPTADDSVPLGTARTLLGWVTLLFVFIGFTPRPFMFTG